MNFVALLQLESYSLFRSGLLPDERVQSVVTVVSSVGPEQGPVRSETLPLAVAATGLTLLSLGTSKGETKYYSDAETRAVYDENHAALKRLQRLLKELRLRECLEGEIISCGFRLVRCA